MSGDYSTPDFRNRFTAQARAAAERSDLIIAVSAFTARQVEQLLHVEPSRIRVIPHGARPAPPSSHTVPREPIILSVGAIQRRKNIVRLVEAFEQLAPGWKLLLAGSLGFDSEAARERIAAQPAQTGYSDAWLCFRFRNWKIFTSAPPSWLSPRSTKASACRYWTPWRAVCRCSLPTSPRCRKLPATLLFWSTPPTSTPSRMDSAALPRTRTYETH